MTGAWFVLVESNTTGSGRLFCGAARDLGLRPVVLARDPHRYPYIAADGIESRVLDTGSLDAVVAACAELPGPVSAVTSSSEYYIATASEAARALGLPHADPAAVRACRDKASQRRILQAAGVGCPDFAVAGSCDEAVAAAARMRFPVVVKPTAGSGSVGVRRCDDAGQVGAAARTVLESDPAALGLPPQSAVLIERYLDGAEFSVETLDDRVIGVTGKHLGAEPYFVEIGHDFPARLASDRRRELGEAALAALRALGLGWGPAHTELRWSSEGIRVIEVNPRLAGGMIPRIVEVATGVDLIRQTVARAAGLTLPPGPARSGGAAIRFLLPRQAGRLAEVSGLADAGRQPGVVEVVLTAELGQQLSVRNSFQDRFGYLISEGEDEEIAAERADHALALIEARIVPASLVERGISVL
ncbi:MAG TPA: ATP-grasp domain-containing protein [Jatrophihabitans sp.]|jgi:argininosuccinate lyase|uniref:ATP-grasp domain-containing protein n=1 Tax=Jatrophihabitans sp. TaxID=1932789 RepID=UPI002F2485CA